MRGGRGCGNQQNTVRAVGGTCTCISFTHSHATFRMYTYMYIGVYIVYMQE